MVPSSKSSQPGRKSIEVAALLQTGREKLDMDIAAGHGGLHRKIVEAAINRPGLALSGFFSYFAHKRVQLLGLAEHEYLRSLTREEREKRLRSVFMRRIPCIVIARNKSVFPEIVTLAEEFQTPVLKTRMITKNFINAATLIVENLMAPRMIFQGTMVEIMGIGVLIEGRAGIGKSETALGLIKKGHALVSDDVTSVRLDSSGAIIGTPVDITRYHIEIRGLGIIHVPSLFGVASVRSEKKLDFIATLCDPEDISHEDRSTGAKSTMDFFGVKIPRMFIPVAPGRDLANVLETAALDMKLKDLGHDAAKELDEKLVSRMVKDGAGNGSE